MVQVRRHAVLRLAAAIAAALACLVEPIAVLAQAPVKRPEPVDALLREAMTLAPRESQYPDCSAVRLLDTASVHVKPDGGTVATYRLSLLLRNANARARSEVSIPYNSAYQKVQILWARTIHPDGGIVVLGAQDVHRSPEWGEFPGYDDACAARFTMPAVEDGSVIDYSWRVVTRPVFIPRQFWSEWLFSGSAPAVICRCAVTVPRSMPLHYRLHNDHGILPSRRRLADGTIRYSWRMRQVPPIRIEPQMPPLRQAQIWLEATSLTSWRQVAERFAALVTPQTLPDAAIRRKVADITSGASGPTARARAIYDWVAQHTRTVGRDLGMAAFRPHAASEVFRRRYGDCKDKATLLITMLRIGGIRADPALLQTNSDGIIPNRLPSLAAFDHCIALATVAGRAVWLDPTSNVCSYGDVPYQDRGCDALVIDSGKGTFQRIPPYHTDDNKMNADTTVTLRRNGDAGIAVAITITGYGAQTMRAALQNDGAEERRATALRLCDALAPGATMQTYTIPAPGQLSGPVKLTLTAEASGWAQVGRGSMLAPMMGARYWNGYTNPFPPGTREWPIVSRNGSSWTSTTRLLLPNGWTLLRLPANTTLSSPSDTYTRTSTTAPDGRSVTVTETVTVRRGSSPPGSVTQFAAYFDALSGLRRDVIVLKPDVGAPVGQR
ncbi:MAG: DUF3857 domain-containing protein [Armatimonadetes bacterium]|nr:DUF3857 domain-containing protein [Armatimonadota bacterium]MDE2207591.1 DUF3857 domain-containing protein [Armatimonadota bacterium]